MTYDDHFYCETCGKHARDCWCVDHWDDEDHENGCQGHADEGGS